MKKEFSINIFILLLVNVLIKAPYIFVVETSVQNIMGPEKFGLYFSLFGLVFLHQFINDPGIQNYNTIFIAQNREKVFSHVPKLLGTKLILLLCLIVVSCLSAFVIGHRSTSLIYTSGLATVLFLSTLFVLLRSTLSSLGAYRIDALLSGLDRLILIFILCPLIFKDVNIGIINFIAIQLLCYALCVATALYFLNKKGVSLIPKFDLDYSKQFVKSCLPYAFIILLTAIVMRADGVLIERLLPNGAYQAGLYSAAFRFMDGINMFGLLFGALILPMMAHKLSHNEEISDFFAFVFKILLVISSGIGLGLFLFSDNIFSFFYKVDYRPGIEAMQILMLAVVPVALTQIFGALLLASKQIKYYNFAYIIVVIFNLIINFILIPILGIKGAAITALLSQMCLLICMIYLTNHFKIITLHNKTIFKSIVFFMASGCLFYIVKQFVPLPWLAQICIGGILTIVISFVSKFIEFKELKQLD